MRVLCGKLVQIWFILSYPVIIAIIKCLQIILRLTFSKRICQNLETYMFSPVFQYSVFLMDWWSEIRFILHTDGEAKDNFFGKENAMCFMNTENNFLQKLVMAKLSDTFDFVQINDNNVFQWNDINNLGKRNSSTYRQIGGNQYWCVLFPEQNPNFQCLCDNINQLGPSFSHFQTVLSKQHSSEPNDNLAAIYDISIIIIGDKTDIIPRHIFDKESINVHVYLKRIPIDEMPHEESQQKRFLNELNKEKKFATHQFLDNGEFLECQTGINIIEQYEFEPSVRSAVSFVLSSTFTLLVFASVIFTLTYIMYR